VGKGKRKVPENRGVDVASREKRTARERAFKPRRVEARGERVGTETMTEEGRKRRDGLYRRRARSSPWEKTSRRRLHG